MFKLLHQENQTNIAEKMQHNLKCIKTLLCCEACDGVADTIVIFVLCHINVCHVTESRPTSSYSKNYIKNMDLCEYNSLNNSYEIVFFPLGRF